MADGYAWSTTVKNVAVGNGGELWLDTPGFEDPEDFDTEGAEVVHSGRVLQKDERSLDWESDFSAVEITNLTDTPWEPADTVYLTVTTISGGGSDTSEARIDQLEIEVDKLHSRIKTLETSMIDVQTRLTALENPPAP